MKLVYAVLALALITPVSAIALSSGSPGPNDTSAIELTRCATFENGTRYQDGSYPIIVLSGSFGKMGRHYRALMKDELRAENAMLVTNLTERGSTLDSLREDARQATAFQPERMKELTAGMAETTGRAQEDVALLFEGPIFFARLPGVQPGCSFLAAWGNYTPDGSIVLSRNYDQPDVLSVFDPNHTLVVDNPTDGSNGVATFGPAGTRPETLANSTGLFIADDNAADSGGDLPIGGRPDRISEFFRLMLAYSDMEGLDAGIQSLREDTAWIVNAAGPDVAYSDEETVYDSKRREGDERIVAANHVVDPSWRLAAPPAEHSTTRYRNLLNLTEQHRGVIDGEEMIRIRDVLLRNGGATFHHDLLGGYPYSSTHQVIFVPKTSTLWIKVVDRDWQRVKLSPLFAAGGTEEGEVSLP